MKSNKMSLVVLSVLLALSLSVSLAMTSWAGSKGGNMGTPIMGAMHLTPEQAEKIFDLQQKFMDETAAVRKQMVIKQAELAVLQQAGKPDAKAISAKQKELHTLQGPLQKKREAFHLEALKIDPKFGQQAFKHSMGRQMHGPDNVQMHGPGSVVVPGGVMGTQSVPAPAGVIPPIQPVSPVPAK